MNSNISSPASISSIPLVSPSNVKNPEGTKTQKKREKPNLKIDLSVIKIAQQLAANMPAPMESPASGKTPTSVKASFFGEQSVGTPELDGSRLLNLKTMSKLTPLDLTDGDKKMLKDIAESVDIPGAEEVVLEIVSSQAALKSLLGATKKAFGLMHSHKSRRSSVASATSIASSDSLIDSPKSSNASNPGSPTSARSTFSASGKAWTVTKVKSEKKQLEFELATDHPGDPLYRGAGGALHHKVPRAILKLLVGWLETLQAGRPSQSPQEPAPQHEKPLIDFLDRLAGELSAQNRSRETVIMNHGPNLEFGPKSRRDDPGDAVDFNVGKDGALTPRSQLLKLVHDEIEKNKKMQENDPANFNLEDIDWGFIADQFRAASDLHAEKFDEKMVTHTRDVWGVNEKSSQVYENRKRLEGEVDDIDHYHPIDPRARSNSTPNIRHRVDRSHLPPSPGRVRTASLIRSVTLPLNNTPEVFWADIEARKIGGKTLDAKESVSKQED